MNFQLQHPWRCPVCQHYDKPVVLVDEKADPDAAAPMMCTNCFSTWQPVFNDKHTVDHYQVIEDTQNGK